MRRTRGVLGGPLSATHEHTLSDTSAAPLSCGRRVHGSEPPPRACSRLAAVEFLACARRCGAPGVRVGVLDRGFKVASLDAGGNGVLLGFVELLGSGERLSIGPAVALWTDGADDVPWASRRGQPVRQLS